MMGGKLARRLANGFIGFEQRSKDVLNLCSRAFHVLFNYVIKQLIILNIYSWSMAVLPQRQGMFERNIR